MAVVGPHLCGLGGDVLAMVAPPGSAPEALLSVGRAGAGSDAAQQRAEGMATMPLRGDIRSVQVPGAVDGWLTLHERYGRLPLDDVLAPAIELAADGFAASIMLALASHLVHAVPGAGELCPDGPLEVGQTVRLPGIARTLRAIAAHGRDGFYGGEFGQGLLELGGGHFAPSDLATSAASWCTPLRAGAWGHHLWTVPPPSQGYLTLAGAAVAGDGRARDRSRRSPVGPPARRGLACRRPRPPGRAVRRRRRRRAARPRTPGRPPRRGSTPCPWPRLTWHRAAARRVPTWRRFGDGDTTHLCALDADGLGVSLTQSNALDFGSHLVEPRTGVFLHNRGVGFSLVEGHPAEVAPGRRPPHTLSPMLVTGRERRAVASRGGHGRRRPAADHRPAPRPPPAREPGPGDGHRRAAVHPRRARRRPLPPVVGRGPHRRGRGRRAPGVARGARRSRPPGQDHQRLRPRRRRLRPDHPARARRRRLPPPGRGVGPPQPGRRARWAAERRRSRVAGAPLRIASLAKQVPLAESFRLDDGRLVRAGVGLEMNPYCRRAVAEGVTLARDSGGTCTVVTLGPEPPRTCCARRWPGERTRGLHVCDPAFAGSDTLATARTLAAVLRAAGPFDLVLLGRNSVDGETGQVGPELAELLDLPFAGGVRRLEDLGAVCGSSSSTTTAPRRWRSRCRRCCSVAERLCDPCKVDPEGRAAVSPAVLTRLDSARLGPGPWGRRAARRWSGRRGPWSTSAPCASSKAPWRTRWRRRCASSPGVAP